MSDAGFELIADVGVLQQAVDNMNAIVSECTFEFREDELFLGAVDPANVGMVHQYIGSDAFEHYHASGMEIGVDTQRLDDYLGKIQSDTVEIVFDTEKRRLDITGESVDVSMAAIDPDTVRNRPEQPDVDDNMDTHLVTEGGALDHGIDVCRMVSDHVMFQTDPDRDAPFHMAGEGDVDDVRVRFDNAVISADYGAEAESLINGEYVENLAGVIPTDAEVSVRHGDEFPIFMDWDFAEGDADVSMMVAPRITSQ
jgi:proliferating cell nuclear antigen